MQSFRKVLCILLLLSYSSSLVIVGQNYRSTSSLKAKTDSKSVANKELTGFDWDAHIGHIVDEEMTLKAEQRREELKTLGEWQPESDAEAMLVPEDDWDLDPDIPRQRWTDVDPEAYEFRNPPDSSGATWSRIRLRSDWFQFDDQLQLKEDYVRFDVKKFTVSATLFQPNTLFEFEPIDPLIAAKLLPVLRVFGGTIKLLGASQTRLKFKYLSDAKNRIGVETYAKGVIAEILPSITEIQFDSVYTVDRTDGAATWSETQKGLPTTVF
mmetsp:Transcript_15139/g.22730  ORF Transcript_15139/g.22730 Transcript_15139/m.22730 type:complete len:268 (+) Transcript_15139:51-854(+)